MLEGQQVQNVTCFIPMSSTNISITYTAITTIETQPHLIGVKQQPSKSFTIRPILNEIDPLKQFLIS